MTGPILETPRLILRPPQAEDFEPWAAFHADEEAMRHIGGVQGREMTWRSVCAMAGAWTIRGFSMFSVIEKETGRWIGRLGPWQPEGWPGTEIGWGLVPAAQGRGFALEGARAAMDYAADILGWQEIIHTIDADNTASIRLATRLGSRLLRKGAAMPPPFKGLTCDVYGQSAEDWRARRATE